MHQFYNPFGFNNWKCLHVFIHPCYHHSGAIGSWQSYCGLPTTRNVHWILALKDPSVFLGEGNGNPLQCSCLENPRDRRAWWAAVCGVAQSRHDWSNLAAAMSSLVGEDSLGEGMATYSSVLPWETPWTEEPGRLQSMRLQRIRYNLATKPPLPLLVSPWVRFPGIPKTDASETKTAGS